MDFKKILVNVIGGLIESNYHEEIYEIRRSEFMHDGSGTIDFEFEVIMYNDWLDSKKLYTVRGFIMNDFIKITGRTFRADIL